MFDNFSHKTPLPILITEDTDPALVSMIRTQQWQDHEPEGQLAVDIAQTDSEVIVVAAMAGTSPDKIELHLHNDLLTIRGERRIPVNDSVEYFFQECYWGKFSRSIILPVEVKAELIEAQYKNGVLVVRLPKAATQREIPILVIDE